MQVGVSENHESTRPNKDQVQVAADKDTVEGEESGRTAEAPELMKRVEDLEEQLRIQGEQSKEYMDKYLRVLAEMENLRKRLDRERAEIVRFGSENLLLDLLPIVDSVKKAFGEPGPSESQGQNDPLQKGVELLFKQLSAVLVRHGVEAIESKDQPFDPSLHQAIQRIEAKDVEEERVAEEFQTGYRLHGRLLRPAMVSVVVPPSATKGN